MSFISSCLLLTSLVFSYLLSSPFIFVIVFVFLVNHNYRRVIKRQLTAIQDDNKFHIIKEIKGSYNNVIGFPIEYIKEDIDKLINS